MLKSLIFLLSCIPMVVLSHTTLHDSWVVTTDLWCNPSYQAL